MHKVTPALRYAHGTKLRKANIECFKVKHGAALSASPSPSHVPLEVVSQTISLQQGRIKTNPCGLFCDPP